MQSQLTFELGFVRHYVCNLLGIHQRHVFPIDANEDITNVYLAREDARGSHRRDVHWTRVCVC